MLIFLIDVTRVLFTKTEHHGTLQRLIWIASIIAAFQTGVFPTKAVAGLKIGIIAAVFIDCPTAITFRLLFIPVPAFGIVAS